MSFLFASALTVIALTGIVACLVGAVAVAFDLAGR